jgi:AP-1 complex subunit beta-1
LDIDFDGAAPASMQKQPPGGASGLEGLAGTPQRVASPTAVPQPTNNMDDLMGIFGSGPSEPAAGSGAVDDLMNGFGGLNMGGASQSPPAQQQKQSNDDILGLF